MRKKSIFAKFAVVHKMVSSHFRTDSRQLLNLVYRIKVFTVWVTVQEDDRSFSRKGVYVNWLSSPHTANKH